MILKDKKLFDLPEGFVIQIPDHELCQHFERINTHHSFELWYNADNPSHCHGLKSKLLDLRSIEQYFFDTENDMHIAYLVQIYQSSLRVLKSSLGGAVDAFGYQPNIFKGSQLPVGFLKSEKIFYQYLGNRSSKSVFDEALSSITSSSAFCETIWYRISNLDTNYLLKNMSPRTIGNDR
jgi:hypothetical protein